MVPAIAKRRSSRQMAGRKRSQYLEPDTDDDLMEPSDDYDDTALPRELSDSPRPSKKSRTTRHQPETRSKSSAKSKAPIRSPKKHKVKTKVIVVGKARKPKQLSEPERFRGPSDGVIPPWTTLPYQILRDIFLFGAQVEGGVNMSWLVGVAVTNRAFTKPALDAMCYSPTISSPVQLHGLLATLKKHQGFSNYNTAVKELVLNVQVLAYTAHNKALFQLGGLVSETPQLHHLEIRHPTDEPPYRERKVPHWYYPRDLFMKMQEHNNRLSAWRWTREMLKDNSTKSYMMMESVHDTSIFRKLRRLVLCRFEDDRHTTPSIDGEGEGHVHDIWSAIAKLSNLKDITFISCNAVKLKSLKQLPKTLERLALCGCLEANSDVLAHYLEAGGLHLRELILNHNPALDLAFLPDLRRHCPQLEILRMSMIFYSEYQNIDDGQPLYDELLQADEIPAWPKTMRGIDIQHMQKCTAEGAINLFQSLVDSAEELPALRHIALQSHLDIPWRDRAGFRDRWIDLLQRVFKRKYVPPFEYLGSKRQYRLWQDKQRQAEQSKVSTKDSSVESAQGAVSRRRSQRIAPTTKPQTRSPDVSQHTSDDSMTDSVGGDQLFIQGLCDVVDIQIDNQRPRETQMTEQNFLDREASGDEDWTENAGDPIDDGYAW